MTDTYPPPSDLAAAAHVKWDDYQRLYKQSIDDPDRFWLDMAERLDWISKPTKAGHSSFTHPVSIEWFSDGTLNACYNCVDRHLTERGDQTALIFEPDDPDGENRAMTFRQLHESVCRLASLLKQRGVQKGDRVTIYLPMILEAVVAMLACARIGAVHSVVFSGFSAGSLKDRLIDCGSTLLITADISRRAGKSLPLKVKADEALEDCPDVRTVIVYRHENEATPMERGRDVWWDEAVENLPADCPCEPMNAEDPLFILYTSGSTGKPKGVLHTTGGFLLFSAMTHEMVFDYRPGEIYWCTADVGWITGHSYIAYGPLANAATTLIFEGVPTWPDAGRFWQIVDKHKVNIFYTAPTAIRALMREGNGPVEGTSRASLRILGSVGEPINPEAWHWYHDIIGGGRCPIVDTWWQTETGGHLITPLPGATTLKPGSATFPFFGIEPVIVDNDGKLLDGACEGNLCVKSAWPGQMRSLYGDHERFEQTYFSTYKGLYFTGDGCRRDEDGYYWITGRVDDVINVSGHRFGTAEIEAAINQDDDVAESAVVGFPHDLKGQGIYAYITLNAGVEPSDDIKARILKTVRRIIGPIATPDVIHWAPGLPKTRSGKIMRRILRKIAANDLDSLGDTSTLADPDVVDQLVSGRPSP